MRSLNIQGVARRQWPLVVAGLLATAALAVAAFVLIGPSREIKASALLLPPATSVVSFPAVESPVNPFLRLEGMDPALSVLVTQMSAEEMSDRLLSDAPETSYTIAGDPLSPAPIVVITVSGTDATEANRVLDRVTKQAPLTLNQLQKQASIPSDARITLVPLVRDEAITVVWNQLLRLEILIIGAGFVGTLLLAGLWDAIAQSKALRRELSPGGSDTPSSNSREPTEGGRRGHSAQGSTVPESRTPPPSE